MRRPVEIAWALLWCSIVAVCWMAALAHAGDLGRSGEALPRPEHLPASALGQDVVIDGVAQLEARLIVSSDPEPLVGLLLDLAEGWHVYWRNPGDTGLAPRIEITADGFEVGEIVWPAPSVFEESDGLFTTFGYSERVLLSVDLRKAKSSAGSAGAAIRAEANILICRTECIPATFSLSTPLVPEISVADQGRIDRLFVEARAMAPVSNDDLGLDVAANWVTNPPVADEPVDLAIRVRTCPTAQSNCDTSISSSRAIPFLPFETVPFELANQRIVQKSDPPTTPRSIEMTATRFEDGESRMSGLVVMEDIQGRLMHVAIDVPIENPKTAIAPPPLAISFGAWLQILVLAILGGLILNGMPCVLPVLAIKIVAIADLADKSRREVRIQGLAYTAGILGSMAILAGVIVALRQAGHSVGWGFQFQEPYFVATISAILVAFALNLFGVFEIDFGQGRLAQVGQTGSGTRRSLFEGLLAVVLATPCTAPFLGTAVGFAFAASSWTILTIFLAIGLGLALPFLLVSFAPGLAGFIPRSGPWMMTLRAGLGFCLLATVVWLLWIVGQSGGTEAVIGLTAMLLFLSFLLWSFGRAQPLRSVWLARGGTIAITAIAFAGFNLIGFESMDALENLEASDPARSTESSQSESGWAPYSEAAVSSVLAQGRPAFIVFTADWCITCKINEKTVLERASIREAFEASGHALFKADWTRRDETIRSKLSEFGRAGVPLYLVYSPDAPDQPEVLSELLSQDEVRAALARSAPERG